MSALQNSQLPPLDNLLRHEVNVSVMPLRDGHLVDFAWYWLSFELRFVQRFNDGKRCVSVSVVRYRGKGEDTHIHQLAHWGNAQPESL